MPPQYPRITVSDTSADEPALITGILQFAGIRSEKVDFSVKTSDVILSAMDVSTYEAVENLKIERNGGYIAIDMLWDLSGLDVDDNRAVLLTPWLVNGNDSSPRKHRPRCPVFACRLRFVLPLP